MLIVGEKDEKFVEIMKKMYDEIRKSKSERKNLICEKVEIPNCGHAVHLENPLPLIQAVRKFLTRVKQNPACDEAAV